jgi:hypothetical protein
MRDVVRVDDFHHRKVCLLWVLLNEAWPKHSPIRAVLEHVSPLLVFHRQGCHPNTLT